LRLLETEGVLTKTPQNVVVLRGQDAVLNCSTDAAPTSGQNPILWNYDHDVISYSPCTSQNPGFVASPPDSATDCNIRALSSWEYGISGAYRCTDFTAPAVAMVIVLGELAALFSWSHLLPSIVMSRCFVSPSVRPSVCPSVAYIANNPRTKGQAWSNSERGFPHIRYDSHTSFKVKRSKVKVIWSINADTHPANLPHTAGCYCLAYLSAISVSICTKLACSIKDYFLVLLFTPKD